VDAGDRPARRGRPTVLGTSSRTGPVRKRWRSALGRGLVVDPPQRSLADSGGVPANPAPRYSVGAVRHSSTTMVRDHPVRRSSGSAHSRGRRQYGRLGIRQHPRLDLAADEPAHGGRHESPVRSNHRRQRRGCGSQAAGAGIDHRAAPTPIPNRRTRQRHPIRSDLSLSLGCRGALASATLRPQLVAARTALHRRLRKRASRRAFQR
jgi:hypothetical protein